MPLTDYEDASLELARPKRKRRGATYGKRAARTTAAAAPAPSRAPISSDSSEGARKRTRDYQDFAHDARADDDAYSESAGDDDHKLPATKRARRSTSLADLLTTTVTTSAPLRPSLSHPSPIKLASTSQSSRAPELISKRSSSALTNRRGRSKPLRAPSVASSSKNKVGRASSLLMRVGVEGSSESEGELRARKKGKKNVGDVAMPCGDEDAPGLGKRTTAVIPHPKATSKNMEIDENPSIGPSTELNVVLEPDRVAHPVPPASVAPSPLVKSVLGDKSNFPRGEPASPLLVSRHSSLAPPTLGTAGASSRRHSSMGGAALVSRRSSTIFGGPRTTVYQDVGSPSIAGLRDEGARRSRSVSTAPSSRDVSVQPVAFDGVAHPALPSGSRASMDLASLSLALPARDARSPSPILIPRIPLAFPVTSATTNPTHSGLEDLELDEQELDYVYRPPMPNMPPRGGSAIMPHPGIGLDSSMVVESYDDDGGATTASDTIDADVFAGAGPASSKSADVDAAESTLEARAPDAPDPGHAYSHSSPAQLAKLPIPARRPRAHVDEPSPDGPASDEDDLAYMIRTHATGEDSPASESEDDEAVLAANEREIGKSLAPGGRIDDRHEWGKSRRSRFLRQVREWPGECEEGASDDELTLL